MSDKTESEIILQHRMSMEEIERDLIAVIKKHNQKFTGMEIIGVLTMVLHQFKRREDEAWNGNYRC